MDFIKEFCPSSKTVVIRSKTYGSQLSMFMEMVFSAQHDGFPVYPDNCKVVQYGGDRYARTFGIEFYYEDAPEEYTIIRATTYLTHKG